MSRLAGQQRVLDGIEETLLADDQHLGSLTAGKRAGISTQGARLSRLFGTAATACPPLTPSPASLRTSRLNPSLAWPRRSR